MRRLKSFAPVSILIGLAIVWFVFISEPLSHWFSRVTDRSRYNGKVIGHVVRAEGSVRVLHNTDIQFVPSPTDKPVEIRDGDKVQISVYSKAIIILNSQDEIEFGSSSLAQFQLWNPKDQNSPIYIHVLLGELVLKKAGAKGRAYVIKDGKLSLPGQIQRERPMALTVLRNAPLDMTLAVDADFSAQDDFVTDTSGDEVNDTTAPEINSAAPETLSNEYIEQVILSRQGQLQKCWLTRLKDAPNLKGKLVIQLEITRRGQVKDARIIDGSIDDETLKSCVTSVFSRLSFRQFKGPEISLSYPISFE